MKNSFKTAIVVLVLVFQTGCTNTKNETTPEQDSTEKSVSVQEKYINPIIPADYSDPDVIRVGEDYYLTASSFNMVPGLPVLHSKDLVNWTIIGHGIQELPDAHFTYRNRKEDELDYNMPRLGKGVYAPCIRYHDGYFWIFWADPDAGAYMVKAKNPAGPWSKPHLIKKAQGWIDTSPLWDEETGRAWLSYAYAKSRTGFNSRIAVAEMNWEAKELLSHDKVVFDAFDREKYPADREHFIIEGTKFMKRNGYYYILCPAGSVPTGWQTAMRSKSPEGPYEIRVICETGNTKINGPHQGGLVDTPNGDWWFINFQSVNVLGRISWLHPAKWVNDWPVIGTDKDGDGIGNPVMGYTMPNTGYSGEKLEIQKSDDFSGDAIGLQWQWPANSGKDYFALKDGMLSIKSYTEPSLNFDLAKAPNVITQMFLGFKFSATAKLKLIGDGGVTHGGLSVMGRTCFDIGVVNNNGDLTLSVRQGNEEEVSVGIKSNEIYLKLAGEGKHPLPLIINEETGEMENGDVYGQFLYSYDGTDYQPLGSRFKIRTGTWIGARVGLFCIANQESKSQLLVDHFKLDTL